MKAVLVTNLASAYRRELFDALGDETRVEWSIFFAQPNLRPDQQREYPDRVAWTAARHGRFASTAAMLVRSSPDCVVVGGSGVQAVVCVVYSLLARVPVGIWWGGTASSESRLGPTRHWFRRRLFGRVSFFLCYAPESASYLEGLGIPPSRFHVLGNATLDVEAFGAAAALARLQREQLRAALGLEAPVVLSVGRLKASKNHKRLVRAFLEMRAVTGKGSLLLVGDGSEKARLKRAHVTILPSVPWRRMPELYGLSDVYAHPSLIDLWPQAVSEALASQTPVVVSAQSGFARFLDHGRQALVANGESTSELAAALLRLVECPDLRQRLGKAGLDAVAPLGCRHLALEISDVVLAAGL